MKLILKWLLSAAALLAVAHLYSGVQVASFTSALVAALVIGLLITLLRPVLVLLTVPVTIAFYLSTVFSSIGLVRIGAAIRRRLFSKQKR